MQSPKPSIIYVVIKDRNGKLVGIGSFNYEIKLTRNVGTVAHLGDIYSDHSIGWENKLKNDA